MSEVKLTAESRSEFGKGASRRLRRSGKVPAVLYGHGTAPLHVALDGHATMMALKQANVLLALDLGDKVELALPKDVQRDPVKGSIEHVDLLLVRRGEKVSVDVHLNVVGTPIGGALVVTEISTLSVEAEATNIPQSLEIDVNGAEPGLQIHAKDVKLPAGVVLAGDPDLLVVHVNEQGGGAAEADEAAEA